MHYAGATFLGELVVHRRELVGNHAQQLRSMSEDRLELGDRLFELGHLLLELGTAESCQATERHVQDVVRLVLGERERLGHEIRPCLGAVFRAADRGDDLIQHVERAQQSLDDVGALARLAQTELRAPGHDFDLVGDVRRERLGEVHESRHTVDQGEHVDAEARLELGVLEQVVQHDVWVGVASQGDDEARLSARGEIVDRRDPRNLAGFERLGDLLLDHFDRCLVGDLANDNLWCAVARFGHFSDGRGSSPIRAPSGTRR